jgi:NAD(P)-dependent dehydrogenase (short-subunit alcohol dehydrogenase family)
MHKPAATEAREEIAPNDRENRVALVTGGLRGSGKAMALGVARHPADAIGYAVWRDDWGGVDTHGSEASSN